MYIMIGMMSAGACFLSARGIGAQDYDKVNRVFNHHLYYVIVSALLVIALLLPFADEVAGMITTNGRLQPMLRPYIHEHATGHSLEGVQAYQPQVHEWSQLHLSEFLSRIDITPGLQCCSVWSLKYRLW